jgi:hypothetical protein
MVANQYSAKVNRKSRIIKGLWRQKHNSAFCLHTAAFTGEIAMLLKAVGKFSESQECIYMITPCSQPLKINPFTCYRDPATGRWTTVVTSVENACETDSSLKAKAEGENEGKAQRLVSASPAVSLPKKSLSFSLPPLKKLAKKSAVTVSR